MNSRYFVLAADWHRAALGGLDVSSLAFGRFALLGGRRLAQLAFLLVSALLLSSCDPEAAVQEGVQLWDGGPHWATENLTAANGSHQLTYDEACAAQGLGWRLPSEEEFMALKEHCSWKWIDDGSRIGFEVTGIGGQSVFFPAEGYASRNITRKYDGILGFYWTSSEAGSGRAREIYMDENYAGSEDRGRDNGLSVRLVCDNYAPVMAEVKPCVSYTGRGNAGEELFAISFDGACRYSVDPVRVVLEAPAGTATAVKLLCNGKVAASSSPARTGVAGGYVAGAGDAAGSDSAGFAAAGDAAGSDSAGFAAAGDAAGSDSAGFAAAGDAAGSDSAGFAAAGDASGTTAAAAAVDTVAVVIDTLTFDIAGKFRGRVSLDICVDIAPEAAEGSVVKARLLGLSARILGSRGGRGVAVGDASGGAVAPVAGVDASGRIVVPIVGGTDASREVLLARKCLYRPGDYGSKFWRIPAIRQLSDGTLLAVNDRRNDTEEDLPGRIDVVYRYSMDGGRTWSEPGFIARNGGYMHGFGDPSLVECEDGTVICMFCGGQTFRMSNLEDPQRTYYAVSQDHGHSWSEPVDITSQMWGPDAVNPFCRDCKSAFFSSGNSLVLKSGPHKGRILVASVTSYNGVPGLRNHAVWSDDGGRTWGVSSLAFENGDEAKMVELGDGRVLMSIRQYGDRAFVVSSDGGETWSAGGVWPEMHVTNCNGDLIRYSEGTAGGHSAGVYSEGVLLHSVPDSMVRENVSVFVSYDDGVSWPVKRSICHGPSQYSSLTVLPDGTIGAYIEEQTSGTELWFENFSLGWLVAGCQVRELSTTRVTRVVDKL